MSTLLLIGGVALKALSEVKKGQIAEAQGRLDKEIGLRNQQSLERQRKAEIDAASIEESRIARQGKIVRAQQRAVVGKSGVGLAGATLSVLADAAAQFSMERNLALRRGLIRGQELRERGRIEAAKGIFAFARGKEIKRFSFIKAGGSILGAAGKSGFFD